MAIEDIDHARAAAAQGDSQKPVTVAELAESAGAELVTGEDESTDADGAEAKSSATPKRRGRPPVVKPTGDDA